MNKLIFLLTVIASFSSFSEENPKSVLDSLINKCLNESREVCEMVLDGPKKKKDIILSISKVISVSSEFESSYKINYGLDAYKELTEAFSLSVFKLDSADFKLIESSENKATFVNEEGGLFSIKKSGATWKIDLNNSTFTGFNGSNENQMIEFVNLLIGTHTKLIQMMKNKETAKSVFKTGGIYYLTSIYNLVGKAQQAEFDSILKEHDVDVNSVKQEILSAL